MHDNRERDGTVIIILKKPGEPAIPTFMGVELEDMQKAIGGGHVTNAQIHNFGLLDDVICMVDEDARMKKLTPNLRLGGPLNDTIFGTCYFCAMDEKYELISLTNLQTEAITSWMYGREL
jgi:hypothetical protein